VVALERGVSGVLKTNYYFSGETDQVRCFTLIFFFF
jgi:hypothetical protein